MTAELLAKKLWSAVLTPFYYLEYGSIGQRVQSSVFLSITVSPIMYGFHLISKYVFTDREFVEVLFILLLADLITGMLKHLKTHTFSFKELFLGLLEKIFVSAVGMILFNALGSIQGLEKNEVLLNYFKLVGKLINAFYVGGSAFNNLFLLTGGKFPPVGWMKRMKNFNISGTVEDLTTDKPEKETEKTP